MTKIIIEYDEREYSLNELSEKERALLLHTITIAKKAKERGNHPFGALLADKNGNILLEQGNTEGDAQDCTGHAETTLARKASERYTREELWECTLYSSCEPCVMCTGALYWANIGRLVYACGESELKRMTGDDPRNPTMELASRAVLACGQKNIGVLGPFREAQELYLDLHKDYWHSS